MSLGQSLSAPSTACSLPLGWCLFGSSSLSECFCVEFSMVRREQMFERSAKRTCPSVIQGQGNKMIFSSVQSLSRVWLFATPRTAAHQASLSITNSWSLLTLLSIKLVMPSSHLILCRPLLLLSTFPSIKVFSNKFFKSGGQNVGTSASASALPMNIQDWFLLRLTGMISLPSKGLSESSPTPQFKSISSSALNLLYGPTLSSIHDYWKNHRVY